jgi:Protein of unknown function (DUF3102)
MKDTFKYRAPPPSGLSEADPHVPRYRLSGYDISDLQTMPQWAGAIKRVLKMGPQAVIEAGQMLIDAKKHLKHGEWGRMFDEDYLPLSHHTANCYMKVAANRILSNSRHASKLPASWATLHALSQLEDPVLEEMLNDGKLNPNIQRKDVEEIKKKIEYEGVYIWDELRKALNLVLRFMDKRDLAEVAQAIFNEEDVEEDQEYVDWERLSTLAEWMQKLHDGCQELQEKREKEREEADEIAREVRKRAKKPDCTLDDLKSNIQIYCSDLADSASCLVFTIIPRWQAPALEKHRD